MPLQEESQPVQDDTSSVVFTECSLDAHSYANCSSQEALFSVDEEEEGNLFEFTSIGSEDDPHRHVEIASCAEEERYLELLRSVQRTWFLIWIFCVKARVAGSLPRLDF